MYTEGNEVVMIKRYRVILDLFQDPSISRLMKHHMSYRWIPAFAGMTAALIFSFFLMFHTFSYDGKRHELRIATKLWSDFGAHIPLIRSFSYGPNLVRLASFRPVESPLFPGEPIRYHFGFYALVGLLERFGVRLDWALNIPSALGFAGLVLMIYLFATRLFHAPSVGFLSVAFFLFNGSLSFVKFFREHPLSFRTFWDIVTNSAFPSFGPWDNGSITAFWTLNIYTNQRHLAFSYGLLLCILWLLEKPVRVRTGVVIGILLGLLMFSNFAVFAMAIVFLGWLALTRKATRLPLLAALTPATIFFLWLRSVSGVASAIAWQPGYLIHPPATVTSFIAFWWQNFGLHSVFVPLGILRAPKNVRRLLAPPLVVLFVLPNLYRFSTDMINNHKFFNFFLIIGNMFSAFAVTSIIQGMAGVGTPPRRGPLMGFLRGKRPTGPLIKTLQRVVMVLLIIPLTLSGIIDFFPIINDQKGSIADTRANNDIRFILASTDETGIVANSTWFYHPASLAGRSIFSGYTYFTWSYGYDQTTREQMLTSLYKAKDPDALCAILASNNITAVELSNEPESYLTPNWELWNTLPKAYENPESHRTIYLRRQFCDQ